jgi:hypothetical protein
MKKETLVHLKFEREESKNIQIELLGSQLNSLKILRRLKRYKELREKELNEKIKLYEKLKVIRREISNLERILPKPKIPKVLKKEEPKIPKVLKKEEPKIPKVLKKKIIKKEKIKKINPDSIEGQLIEIQKRLDQIR